MTASPQHTHHWYRPRNVLLFALVLVLLGVGWLVAQVWSVYTATPKITHDYRAEFRQLAAQAAGVPPESGDEAWAKLLEAAIACDRISNEYRDLMKVGGAPLRSGADPYDIPVVDFDTLRLGRALPANIEPELAVLQRLRDQGVFEKLREFAHMGLGFRTGDPTSSMLFELVPELGKYRSLAKARTASMRLARVDRNQDEVAEAFDELLAVAQTISYQPSVIFHLVGQSIQTLAIEELRAELMEFDFDAAHCSKFLESIDRHPLAAASLGLEGERMVFRDFVQRVYTDDGAGNGYLDWGALDDIENGGIVQKRTLAGSMVGRFARADRRETLASYDDYIERCIAECNVPISSRWLKFNADTWVQSLPGRLKLVQIMAPALQKFVDAASGSIANVNGIRLMIALQQYRMIHADFPESLDALVPEFLPTLPIDSYNGKSFVYRRVTDDPDGRPYLLYSMGPDGIDDGGIAQTVDGRSRGIRAKPARNGFDIPFNGPRLEPDHDR